jgi:hypothetical protein
MLDESLVVQSAVSAFNNAALGTPEFFWVGLLMCPLFFVAYKYGNKLMDIIGFNRDMIQISVIKWTICLSLLWIVLFGGNYVVLRDAETVLPFITALIVFMGTVFVGDMTRNVALLDWKKMSRGSKLKIILFSGLVLAVVGLTDTHKWWGPILQIVAFVAGFFVGRKMRYKIRPITYVSVFISLFVIMILMQPEFFRFGQLGNLTWLHLFGLLCVGAPVVGATVLRNTKPANKIYHSAFVKLKWLMRCLVALAGVLFVMTESVPVFIGTCALVGGLIWLKVVHANAIPEYLAEKLFLFGIFSFGILTIMPVISCLAILEFVCLPRGNTVQDIRFLL